MTDTPTSQEQLNNNTPIDFTRAFRRIPQTTTPTLIKVTKKKKKKPKTPYPPPAAE